MAKRPSDAMMGKKHMMSGMPKMTGHGKHPMMEMGSMSGGGKSAGKPSKRGKKK